jgi:hypothetical protein
MDLTYKLRGADGNEYGPATLAQIAAWLREGRITLQTEIIRSDMTDWAPIANFAEFQSGSMTPPPIAPAAGRAPNPAAESQLKSGASWFYWIAGLSLINTISGLSGSQWRFMFGLGISRETFDADADTIVKGIMVALNLIAIVLFIVVGLFAHKRHTWAFITGMIFFTLDGCVSLLNQDWLGLGFHAFALFVIFRGFQACRALNAA